MPDRIEVQYFTTSADSNVHYQEFQFLTGRRSRTLKSIFVGGSTATQNVRIRIDSTDYVSVDFTRFATAEGVVSLNLPVAATSTVSIGLQDGTSAGFTALPVMLGYDL